MVHETIGHLGIFVSGPVSRKEHKEMISSIDQADLLAPGLYEMIILETDDGDMYDVRFEARDMDDIRAMDDDGDDEAVFGPIARVSTGVDTYYRLFVRPFIEIAMNETLAEGLRQLHPLRTAKYGYSDLNPWMTPFKALAENARSNRRAAKADNFFTAMEKQVSAHISGTLDFIREARDLSQELWFQSVWGNPWLQAWFQGEDRDESSDQDTCRAEGLEEMERGGFAEGVVRILSALAHAGSSIDRDVLEVFRDIARRDERLARLVSAELAEAVKKQACILAADPERAIGSLVSLLPESADRRAALSIARAIFPENQALNPESQARLEAVQEVLGVSVP
jgi:hypothetical protein